MAALLRARFTAAMRANAVVVFIWQLRAGHFEAQHCRSSTVAAPMLSASQELSGFSCLCDRQNHAFYSICRCRIMTADHEREDQSSRRLDLNRRLLSNRLGLVRRLRRSLVESARQNHD